jgi:outer membrane protein assembly factor BamC
MKHFNSRNALILLGTTTLLAGCGTVAGWFPDKQKQYQYSTEIPSLEVPPDLTSSTIEGAAARRGVPEAGESMDEREAPVAGEAPEEESAGERESSRPAARKSKSQAVPTLAQSTDDVPLIEVEAPFEIAWVEVAKALGRLELEITDQNRSDGVYYVYYGGDRKPYEDRGFFGDIAEMFGGGEEPSKEYRIKLEEKGKVTMIYILDSENRPQTSGHGFDLLKRLHQTLQSEPGAKPASADAEQSESR